MRLALAAVALVLVLTACGGVESKPALWVESEPDLVQAAERTGSMPSFAFEARWDAAEERDIDCSGAVDNERTRSRLVCADGYEHRRIGDTWYFRRPSTAMWHPTVEDLNRMSSMKSHLYGLDLLLFERGQIRRVGEEVVRGEPTVRYKLTVKCRPLDMCAEPEVGEAWIDGDGLVRRVDVTRFENTEGKNVYRVEYFDFGLRVDVEEPPLDEIQQPRYPLPVRCGSQPAEPITTRDALDVLRRHGFDVRSVEQWCSQGVAATLSNGGSRPSLLKGSGVVLCTLYTDSSRPGEAHEEFPLIVHMRRLRAIENLKCLLAAYGPRADERVSAFEDALAELGR